MQSLDPTRIDLALEYKASPLGPHSQELQHLLKLLRWSPATERYVAAQLESDGPWFLALTTGPKGTPVRIFDSMPFATEGEANWAVFRKRWAEQTGEWLRPEVDDCDDPTLSGYTDSTGLVRRPILGYASAFSVRPGETIEFKVSSEDPAEYSASLIRLRSGDHEAIGRREIQVPSAFDGRYVARHQQIQIGSWIEISPHADFAADSFSLSACIWPTLLSRGEQVIAGSLDVAARTGFALMLDSEGCLSLGIGDGSNLHVISTGVPLVERKWCRVAASFDANTGEVWLCQLPKRRYADNAGAVTARMDVDVRPASTSVFRIAAAFDSSAAAVAGRVAGARHFNGKIEAPAFADAALSEAEQQAIATTDAPEEFQWIAHWDFAIDIPGTRAEDVAGRGHHGEIINLPTRAMMGWHWDGSDYRWIDNPAHYAAIHFHEDDLYDCAWETDFSFTIPEDLKSGLYCAHLEQNGYEDWIPFVVSPKVGKATAKLALILPSTSYWAYANRHGVITYEGREHVKGAFANIEPSALFLHDHPELGLSMYDEHSDGSGVCYSSRLRPIVSLRPGERLWQLPADTHITDWLDESGIDYDVISEDDVHTFGTALLEPYSCVMTGTHPEYPSLEILDAFAQYQEQGGRFIYFGGNGFYWRVSWHQSLPGVIEMRRAEDGIRAWFAEGGEYYHGTTGELGGMWRRMGRAPQSVAGTGMTSQGFDFSTHYERTEQSHDPRAAFIFEGIDANERIGDFGIIGGGAAGWEIDRADIDLGTPPHALVVARATDFSANYHWMKEELTHTHDAITGETCPLVRCDMVFYETPNGGGVFATSSIAWAGSLSHNDYDNNVSRITRNVIERFIDPAPL